MTTLRRPSKVEVAAGSPAVAAKQSRERRRAAYRRQYGPVGLLVGLALLCALKAPSLLGYGGSAAVKATPGHGRSLLSAASTGNGTEDEDILTQLTTCSWEKEQGGDVGWVFLWAFCVYTIFLAIAIIADDFFVPCLEEITEQLGLSADVAGATFMAAGSSAPELFTSLAGVILNHAEVGAGTIVGSAMFNILVIIALSCIFAPTQLDVSWKCFVRDALFYTFSIVLFLIFASDSKFAWWEGLVLICLYIVYIIVMKFNKQFLALLGKIACETQTTAADVGFDEKQANPANAEDPEEKHRCDYSMGEICCNPCSSEFRPEFEEDDGCFTKTMGWINYVLAAPYVWLFNNTIPHEGNWVIISFLMNVIWIGILTYLMVVLVARMGCLIGIDTFTMSLVVLAAGTSVPDALSSIAATRNGEADMAVANALGSNVFDICLGLGIPYMIKTLVDGHDLHLVDSEGRDDGAQYTKFGLILLGVLFFTIGSFTLSGWKLSNKLGYIFITLYVCFIAYALIQSFLCDSRNC